MKTMENPSGRAAQGSPDSARMPGDASLEHFLAERDVACPGCGYNLRNLTSNRCPECAREIRLAIHLVEPRQGWVIAGVIGLSAGLGLSGLLVVYAIIMMLRIGHAPPGKFFGINACGAVIFGALLVSWLRNWSRLRRMPRRLQLVLVIGTWIAAFVFVFIFTFAFM
jgi:hypothetical protein